MNYINKELSKKILTIAPSKNEFGGMSAVLLTYDRYFENFRYIPSFRRGGAPVKIWYTFQAIVRCFFAFLFCWKIRIVHIHGSVKGSVYRKVIFIIMAKIFGKKVVYHQHGGEFQAFFDTCAYKKQLVNIINRCDNLIVLSHSWKEYYMSIGVSEQIIIVLNNIVIPPASIPERHTDGKLHLLYLGEIKSAKGIYDLLNVLAENKEVFKDKIILRVGGIVVEGDINAFIAEKELSSFVQFDGWVSGHQKTECLE